MAEDMTFLPKSAVLSIEEMGELAERFVARGINRIRLTGGEPLGRRNIISLFQALGRHLETGDLDELTGALAEKDLAERVARLEETP